MQQRIIFLATIVFAGCFGPAYGADCPPMDFTGDCRVDFRDFAEFASEWLDEGDYQLTINSYGISGVIISSGTGHGGITNYTQMIKVGTSVTLTAPAVSDNKIFTGWIGDITSSNQTISFLMDSDKTVTANYTGIAWVDINDPGVAVADMNDPCYPSHESFNGQISKYETTNAQYCEFLNAAQNANLIAVRYGRVYDINDTTTLRPYYDLTGSGWTYNGATYGGASRINYTNGVFTVDSGFENHPVTYVSWYGATAFCDYYGYRLPTEWEWQAAADYDGSYMFGCGTTINNSIANYYDSAHPYGTTIAGAFGTYGYGMCELAGNVWELTCSFNGNNAVICGGCWEDKEFWWDDHGISRWQPACTVSTRGGVLPEGYSEAIGFRVCR